MGNRKGRIWTLVMIFIIIGLPVCTALLLRNGFQTRAAAPASSRIVLTPVDKQPAFREVSFRGDTISQFRMQGKVLIHTFASFECVPEIDTLMRKLYEIQSDYYGKTLSLRILTHSLKPDQDTYADLKIMSDRYAGREVWHFLRADDSCAQQLFQWCTVAAEKNYGKMETDSDCPQFVYLVDSEGMFRGAYNVRDENQFHDLFNDVLFLINKLDLHEQEK